MSDKLKPCPLPWCQGEAAECHSVEAFVRCTKCGASSNTYNFMKTAVEEWNTRAQPEAVTDTALQGLKDVHAVQGQQGNWDVDPYMQGMFNGLEMALAMFENREPQFRKLSKKTEAVTNKGDVDWSWLVGKEFYLGTVEEVSGDTASMVRGDDHYRIRISELLEEQSKRPTAEADLATKWGVTLDKDGKPLSRDMCHTLNKSLEADLAKAREVIVEWKKALDSSATAFEYIIGIAEKGTAIKAIGEDGLKYIQSACSFMEGK